MDPTFAVNVAVVVALVLFAISLLLLVSFSVPLVNQGIATLGAIQRLSKTLEDEVPPTMAELRQVTHGINEIRALTTARMNEVGHQVEYVTGSLNQAVDKAHAGSSVLGAGILAGIRTYLGSGKATPAHKQISTDKGE